MMSRIMTLCCITFMLFVLTVNADSHGGGTADPKCTDVDEAFKGVSSCIQELVPILSATSETICEVLGRGLKCLAKELNTGDDEACYEAMMQHLIDTPGLLKTQLAANGISFSLDITGCKVEKADSKCSNINEALKGAVSCPEELASVRQLSTSSSSEEICKALGSVLLCLAKELGTDDEEACAAAMLHTIIETNLVPTIFTAFGAPGLTPNLTTCKKDTDDMPVCTDASSVINQAPNYPDCKTMLQSALYSTDNTVDQCKMLHMGLECLAGKTSKTEDEKEDCVMVMYRHILGDISILTTLIPDQSTTTGTSIPTLDVTACMRGKVEADPKCKNITEALKGVVSCAQEVMSVSRLSASSSGEEICNALGSVLLCLAKQLRTDDEEVCAAAMLHTIIETNLVTTIFTAFGATGLTPNLTTCKRGETDDKRCTDITGALKGVPSCTDELRDIGRLSASSSSEDVCNAMGHGLLCLAKELGTDDDEECAEAMFGSIIGTPGLLTTVLGIFGAPTGLNPDLTTCKKGDDEKVCKDTSAIIASFANHQDCLTTLRLVLTANDLDKCKKLHEGFECIAGKTKNGDEKEVCVMAIWRTMYGEPNILTALLSTSTSRPTVNLTACMTQHDHDICEDVGVAIKKLTSSDNQHCLPFFALVPDASQGTAVQCTALRNGLNCLAKGLVKSGVAQCAAKMMAVIIRSPDMIKEAIEVVAPGVEINLNVSACVVPSAVEKCSDISGVIAESLQYADCRDIFASIMAATIPDAVRCQALRNGFRCLAGKLVEEKQEDLCAYIMQRLVLMDPTIIKKSIAASGIPADDFNLNTTACYNCPKILDECSTDQCATPACKRFPGAKCRRNICGGCTPRYMEKQDQNSMTENDVTNLCPCSGPFVNCFVDPCSVATCDNIPNAKCRSNYCGGCNHNFFLNGRDVTYMCDGSGCPSQDKPCSATTCSQAHNCRYFKEARCVIDKCTCNEVYAYYNKRVNCSEITTGCRKEKMKVEAEELENQANGNTDNMISKKVKCTPQGDYVYKCEGNTCSCLNSRTGEKAKNKAEGDLNIDCSDVVNKTAADLVNGTITASKTKNLSGMTKSTQNKLLEAIKREVMKIAKNKLRFNRAELKSGSIIMDYQVEAVAGSDISTIALVEAVNEDIENGLFPDIVVDGETFTPTDGIVTATAPREPYVAPIDVDDDDDDNTTIIIVVVVVVVAVLLVALAVGCYCFRKSDSRGKSDFTDINGHSNMGYKMQP